MAVTEKWLPSILLSLTSSLPQGCSILPVSRLPFCCRARTSWVVWPSGRFAEDSQIPVRSEANKSGAESKSARIAMRRFIRNTLTPRSRRWREIFDELARVACTLVLDATAQNHFIGQGAGKGGQVFKWACGEKRLRTGVMQNHRFCFSQATIDGPHLVNRGLPVRSYKRVADFGEDTVGFAIVQVNVRAVEIRERL